MDVRCSVSPRSGHSLQVVGGRVMQLFRSHELMAVIVGNENYDWDALESNSQYKNGYASGDQTVSV